MSNLSKEIIRKLVHLTQLVIIALYIFSINYFSQKIALLALTAILLLLLEFEYIRIDYQTKFGEKITALFSKLILRKHEKNNVTGAIFFVIASIITFSVFDFEIALLALLFTVFGDLTAALVGVAYGKKKIFRNKSYAGTLGGAAINIIIGVILMPNAPWVFLPMALIATLVETVTQKLDDNLTVPLFSGFIGQLIVYFSL